MDLEFLIFFPPLFENIVLNIFENQFCSNANANKFERTIEFTPKRDPLIFEIRLYPKMKDENIRKETREGKNEEIRWRGQCKIIVGSVYTSNQEEIIHHNA